MAACSGVTGLAMIPLSLASPSIIGSYRDGTGTYDGFYRMLAALDFVAALLFATFTVLARMLGNSLGHGIFVTSSSVYTLLHFEKYRAIATSLIFIAYGAASVISQVVLARLVQLYELDGALLLYGGVLLNSTVIVMLAKNPWPLQLSRKELNTEPLLKANLQARGYGATTGGTGHHHSPEEESLINPGSKIIPESCSLKQVQALFYEPAFYVLLVTLVVGDYTNLEFAATIVDYGIDKGIDLDNAKHLVTFSAVGQLVGRLVVPLQADFSPFMRHFLYTISFVVLSSCMVALPYVSSCATIFALSTVIGASQGYIICIKFVLFAEYLGVDRTAVAIGLIGILMMPALLVSPSILGLFRDVAGSYDGYYRLMGAVSLMAAVLFAAHDAWRNNYTWHTHSVKQGSPAREAT
ncbi:hypothetical protein HPB50_024181 [Hyalomma asiaticum]|uniref:Uncharacterized protein n=1 Tax=Hyalomma asiaticum TaxID=266040 RepID=A0ACB7SK49_HYAAI|nr:hypothetical protein HPB50_024181 [Hyalomma asiaticum]